MRMVKPASSRRLLGASLLFAVITACGPTVGDPCTTAQDCLGRTCLNGGSMPGGYCTLSCLLEDPNSCPAGTLCIRDGIAKDVNGCFRVCAATRDCRPGY